MAALTRPHSHLRTVPFLRPIGVDDNHRLACTVGTRARRTAVLSLVGVSLFVSPTVARAAHGNVQLAYRVPAECPNRASFASALSARSTELAFRQDGSNRLLSVLVLETEHGYRGKLVLFVEGTPSFERVLEDRQCAALTEALALVAAMELNPPERTTPPSESRSRVAPNQQWKADTRDLGSPGDPAHLTAWSLFVLGGVQTAPSPEPLVTFGLGGAATRHRTQHFSLSLLYGQSGYGDYATGEVRFRWLSSRFVGCPLGVARGHVAVHPCAVAEVGLLRGEARSIADSTNRNGLWLAPGLGLLGSLSTGEFSIDALLGLVRPIVRDRFLFAGAAPAEPSQLVHRADPIGLVSELRLRWAF